MVIKILGTGCPKCDKAIENVEKALRDLGRTAELQKVEDLIEIISYGVMETPAIVVDEEVKLIGKVPTVDEIKQFL